MVLEKSPEAAGPITRRFRTYALAGVDRTLAVFAHAGIGLALFGFGFMASIMISGIIWLRSRHSPALHRESEQAGTYQIAVFVINLLCVGLWLAGFFWLLSQSGIAGTRAGDSALLLGLTAILALVVPPFAIWYFGTILYGLLAALAVARGRTVVYPIVGEWVDRRLERAGKLPTSRFTAPKDAGPATKPTT